MGIGSVSVRPPERFDCEMLVIGGAGVESNSGGDALDARWLLGLLVAVVSLRQAGGRRRRSIEIGGLLAGVLGGVRRQSILTP
jgi:hypothetical protein